MAAAENIKIEAQKFGGTFFSEGAPLLVAAGLSGSKKVNLVFRFRNRRDADRFREEFNLKGKVRTAPIAGRSGIFVRVLSGEFDKFAGRLMGGRKPLKGESDKDFRRRVLGGAPLGRRRGL